MSVRRKRIARVLITDCKPVNHDIDGSDGCGFASLHPMMQRIELLQVPGMIDSQGK